MKKINQFWVTLFSVILAAVLLAGVAAWLMPPAAEEALSQFGSLGTEV